MITTSAIFSAHAIHVLIRNIFIFFIILFITLFIWLSIGIKIDTFKVSDYHLDGLYIKLDKKLTLKIDKLVIPKSKKDPSFNRIDKSFENVKYLLTFFETIDLNQIVFNNNTLDIHFHHNLLQIGSKDYLVRGNVHKEGKILIGEIPLLWLKDQNITLKGKFFYDLKQDTLKTKGVFTLEDLVGDFEASKVGNKIRFSLKGKPFSNIKAVVEKFGLVPAVKSWVVDKVQAKKYQLLSFSGEGTIVNKHFELDSQSLRGKVLFKEVSIDFKKGLKPVLAQSFILSYTYDGGLFFDLKKPRYQGRNLDGTTIRIINLGDENTTLKLDLHMQSPIDKTVHQILAAYDIPMPVIQEYGDVKATVKLDIALKHQGIKVLTDVSLSKGKIVVNHIPFSINGGFVSYANGRVKLHDIVLSHKLYKGKVQGKIDLKKSIAQLFFQMKVLNLKSKEGWGILLKNEKIPMWLNYKKDIEISLPKYKLKIVSKKRETTVTIDDLAKIKPFVSDSIPIENGDTLKIKTKDFKSYTFQGVMKPKMCFFYEKDDVCFVAIPYHGKITANDFHFYALNDRFHYQKSKSRLDLNGVHIDLKRFLAQKSGEIKKSKKAKKDTQLVIIGKKSHLRYDIYSLNMDSYDIEVKNNGDIKAIGSIGGDIVKFSKEDDILKLQALRIKEKALAPLINFYGLQGGRYSLTKTGNPSKVMKGEIIIEGGVMKGFKAYNNTLAFINTLPALAMLHKPGYSTKGFTIKSAVIEYRMIKREKIIFDSIYIRGDSATIVGKGELDLKHKTINVKLNIQVAREFGKVLGNIPLVGYILVGEDKSITVGVKITGSLNQPKVSVLATKELLSYPLELIKRTLGTPQKLLDSKHKKIDR
ncbi:Putative periplasmic protein [hydrothermal vent metagenome]|uniref:Putative periplasmic protein n=1 Tax=hydrothermal vent metagenome TaxID=652676 RepID=A0A1W1BFX3_9ZZZZ